MLVDSNTHSTAYMCFLCFLVRRIRVAHRYGSVVPSLTSCEIRTSLKNPLDRPYDSVSCRSSRAAYGTDEETHVTRHTRRYSARLPQLFCRLDYLVFCLLDLLFNPLYCRTSSFFQLFSSYKGLLYYLQLFL